MSGQVGPACKPLDGVRVLDLSRMIAGGVAGMLLADFGADVVKVEQPGTGDPLRQWTAEGQPFWWKVYARNKRYITLNLKSDDGRELLRQLIPRFDVVLESFVPGTLERLGLGWDVLQAWNPRLILVRISGWGQTGPSSQRPGFGTLVEAASGFAAMNGEPDGAPIVPAFPLADMTSALYAVNAVDVCAVPPRRPRRPRPGRSTWRSSNRCFRCSVRLPAEYTALGRLRERNGSRSKNAGPRGCYRTSDGRYIAVSGSTPKMAERFLQAYQLSHLLQDRAVPHERSARAHAAELDEQIASRDCVADTRREPAHHRRACADRVAVQTVADIERDAHWRARQLLVDVPNGHGTVRMHNVVPRLSATPGEIRGAGGALGARQRRGLRRRARPELRAA